VKSLSFQALFPYLSYQHTILWCLCKFYLWTIESWPCFIQVSRLARHFPSVDQNCLLVYLSLKAEGFYHQDQNLNSSYNHLSDTWIELWSVQPILPMLWFQIFLMNIPFSDVHVSFPFELLNLYIFVSSKFPGWFSILHRWTRLVFWFIFLWRRKVSVTWTRIWIRTTIIFPTLELNCEVQHLYLSILWFHIVLINKPFSDVYVCFPFDFSHIDLLVLSKFQVGSPFSIDGQDLSFDLSFFGGAGFQNLNPNSYQLKDSFCYEIHDLWIFWISNKFDLFPFEVPF